MEKIRLGKTNMMVSRIGFGGIPIQKDTEADAVAVVKKSLELGINYIDTAYAYGTSEVRIGKALKGLHQRPFIATKTSPEREGIKDHIKHSLNTLGIDSIDLYQFHNVSDINTLKNILTPGGPLEILQEAKKAGQIKHIGISSHQIDVAKEIVKSGQFETIMYPFNFVMCEAADELLQLARKFDMGVIAMKPFAGGRIANITLAIKYLWQYPDVVILPGIATIKELAQIIRVLEMPQMMPEEQQELLRLRETYTTRFCRHCDYCMPCPQSIVVSHVMDYEPLSMSFPGENFYLGPMGDVFADAAKCDNCGKCDAKCPYNIPVSAMLAEYVRDFAAKKKKYQAQKSRK